MDWSALEANPHCQQAEHPVSDIPFARILTPDAPRKPGAELRKIFLI
jgi:hypothetical protein